MTVTRAILLAVLLLVALPLVGFAFLYAYRMQGPGGIGWTMPMMGFAFLPMLLMSVVPLAVVFLIVYAAVRLAIRHEREGTRRSEP